MRQVNIAGRAGHPHGITDSRAKTLCDEIKTCLDGLFRAFRDLETTAPEHLFHYTTAEGLLGIVESGKLWASSANFLNDSSEPSYAMETIKSAFEEVSGALQPNSIAARALQGYWEELQNRLSTEAPDVYVFCFCETPDLLSQWRGYGAQCAGYALGFSSAHLRKYVVELGRSEGLYLTKIAYEKGHQENEAKDVFMKIALAAEPADRALCGAHGETRHFTDRIVENLRSAVFSEVVRLSAKFKAGAFREEGEWRLVQFAHRGALQVLQQVRFRSGTKAITPFLELSVGKPPIEKVTVGPTLNPALAIQSLRLAFARHDFPNVQIKASDVPYRL